MRWMNRLHHALQGLQLRRSPSFEDLPFQPCAFLLQHLGRRDLSDAGSGRRSWLSLMPSASCTIFEDATERRCNFEMNPGLLAGACVHLDPGPQWRSNLRLHSGVTPVEEGAAAASPEWSSCAESFDPFQLLPPAHEYPAGAWYCKPCASVLSHMSTCAGNAWLSATVAELIMHVKETIRMGCQWLLLSRDAFEDAGSAVLAGGAAKCEVGVVYQSHCLAAASRIPCAVHRLR